MVPAQAPALPSVNTYTLEDWVFAPELVPTWLATLPSTTIAAEPELLKAPMPTWYEPSDAVLVTFAPADIRHVFVAADEPRNTLEFPFPISRIDADEAFRFAMPSIVAAAPTVNVAALSSRTPATLAPQGRPFSADAVHTGRIESVAVVTSHAVDPAQARAPLWSYMVSIWQTVFVTVQNVVMLTVLLTQLVVVRSANPSELDLSTQVVAVVVP